MADSCLFCRIVAGHIPSRRVYEDDHAIAFLDIQPWHRGHTLVIPRRHVDDALADPTALEEIAPAVIAAGNLLRERLEADGMNLLANTGATAGQEVFHLHVHLVPRYADDPGLDRLVGRGEVGDLDEVLATITRAD
ncbi:MAG TPA: HIT domain-containing protein [Propionibacteriaceae bacterium]|nr:HIT domain-containing protein [Propionibacteriaceae bacterium]HQE31593.1 HIT domain-containing protein [Propionibacteriaceae bacterium]